MGLFEQKSNEESWISLLFSFEWFFSSFKWNCFRLN